MNHFNDLSFICNKIPSLLQTLNTQTISTALFQIITSPFKLSRSIAQHTKKRTTRGNHWRCFTKIVSNLTRPPTICQVDVCVLLSRVYTHEQKTMKQKIIRIYPAVLIRQRQGSVLGYTIILFFVAMGVQKIHFKFCV